MLERLTLLLPVLVLAACSAGTSQDDSDSDSNERSSESGNGTGSTGAEGIGDDVEIVQPPPDNADCDNILEVTYRDFDLSHPDFEMDFKGEVVRRTLIADDLGSDSKPVFASTIGCPWDETTPTGCANWTVTEPEITSKETFDQWYRDVEGVNYRFDRELVLTDQGDGTYVYSSNAFFPIGNNEGWGATPPEHINQNFLFTTEIHLQFTYVAGQAFSFYGDDDLWIFVNGHLALDLGGLHLQARGTIDFDAQAGELGISPGGVYRMDIFHAERHTDASNFQIETTIGCFTPVDVDVY